MLMGMMMLVIVIVIEVQSTDLNTFHICFTEYVSHCQHHIMKFEMELFGECVLQSFYQCMNEQVHPYDPEYKAAQLCLHNCHKEEIKPSDYGICLQVCYR